MRLTEEAAKNDLDSERDSDSMSLGDYLESEMQTQEVKMKLNSIQNSNSTSLLDMTIQDLSETH